MIEHRQPYLNIWMQSGEATKARHEPPHGKRCGDRDREDARLITIPNPVCCCQDHIKPGTHRLQQDLPILGEFNAGIMSPEKRDTKKLLKRLDLMANGALRNREVSRSQRGTSLSCDSFERAQRRQRRD